MLACRAGALAKAGDHDRLQMSAVRRPMSDLRPLSSVSCPLPSPLPLTSWPFAFRAPSTPRPRLEHPFAYEKSGVRRANPAPKSYRNRILSFRHVIKWLSSFCVFNLSSANRVRLCKNWLFLSVSWHEPHSVPLRDPQPPLLTRQPIRAESSSHEEVVLRGRLYSVL
jgi:hypothetical protein